MSAELLRTLAMTAFAYGAAASASCSTDADCSSDQWCRAAQNADGSCSSEGRECVPRAEEGASCGGFTWACQLEVCQTGLGCLSPPGLVDAAGTCTAPCASDADCSSDQWCRQLKNADDTCSTYKACVPRVAEGASCLGFKLPCEYDQCLAGLDCVGNQMLPDLPGVCTAPGRSCETHDDCDTGQWCRNNKNDDGSCSATAMSCVAYVAEGGICSGSVPLCELSVCVPGMECTAQWDSVYALRLCTVPVTP